MNATIVTLLLYVAWTMVLLFMLAYVRVSLTLTGKRQANSFDPSGVDVSPFCNRLCRAHANCYESFPILGGLLLLAIATDNTAITDGLAYYLIGARILQSTMQLVSSSNVAVQFRFAFFVAQLGIAVWWIVQFIKL
ncbi:MAG: MAPEG family protein [Proteobacteria bacterium]|nr:MAPEG family protein [Pseudomonadota bacterium]